MRLLAFDIGGANIKVADGLGFAASRPFPLWREYARLAEELKNILAAAPPADRLAVAMTGELADCFANKREGVDFILRAAEQAAEGRQTSVYLVDGRFVRFDEGRENPLLVAAANWHALARLAGTRAPRGAALLVDVGSTTCDLVPLVDGYPAPRGTTDPARLLSGELIYAGVERTPACALVSELPWRGAPCPVAREWFASACDAYIILGDLPEDPRGRHTADGRPATAAFARRRLARMICADDEMFSDSDARRAARAIAAAELRLLTEGVGRIIGGMAGVCEAAVISGSGEFLAQRAIQAAAPTARIVSLRKELGDVVSICAAAHATAVLAREGFP